MIVTLRGCGASSPDLSDCVATHILSHHTNVEKGSSDRNGSVIGREYSLTRYRRAMYIRGLTASEDGTL